MSKRHLFTSESVTEGHPDKIADQISDVVLDAMLSQDPGARVACETIVTTGLALVTGEITADAEVDITQLVRDKINQVGYTDCDFGFNGDRCAVLTALDKQSEDISQGVDLALDAPEKDGPGDEEWLGAGDQGLMFGYACRETDLLMPLPIHLAHRLAEKLTDVRKTGELGYLRPDGKTQVTIEYGAGGTPRRLDTVVVSGQHDPDVSLERLREEIIEAVVVPTVDSSLIDDRTKFFVNPTGRFVLGGPEADTGLTGRKVETDTYGSYCRHGGGAFSGKDPTKPDRSGAYMARYAAKNVVAAGLATRCELQVAYAIGVARPVSLSINTYGTAQVDEDHILRLIDRHFDFRPGAIIESLDLRRPIYSPLASYGHFGRPNLDLSWERTDKARILADEAGL